MTSEAERMTSEAERMTSETERESHAPADPAAAPASVEQDAPSGVDGAAAELAELKDRLLRALAEQENFRRRAERERAEAVKFAAADVVKDLLATADNLARALASVPPELAAQDEAMRNLLAGVAATERILHEAFIKHGIRKIEPIAGESFDPDLHQALFEVAESEYPPGAVAEVLLPGYTYHQRLLRPALVGVADGRASASGRH
jgi:molecular chaperone GrpE